MEKFKCDICNKTHDLYYESMILLEPDLLRNMSQAERNERVKTFNYFLLIDDSYYLSKADLFLNIRNSQKSMHWEVWVKLGLKELHEMTQKLGKETSSMIGELFIQLPHYKASLGTKVNLTFFLNDKIDYPEAEIIDRNSELGQDFHDGISKQKIIEWMKEMYHPAGTTGNNQKGVAR